MDARELVTTLLVHTRQLVWVAALLGLAGCAWAPPPNTSPTSPVSARHSVPAQAEAGWSSWGEGNPEASFRQHIVQTAMAMMGTPYVYGGTTPRGFDCSGLVQYSYHKAGINVPRTSRGQYRSATPVPVASARPGDLVFFASNQKISHVGIYLGDDEFIHAPETGQSVKISSIQDAYYQARFVGAGRIPKH